MNSIQDIKQAMAQGLTVCWKQDHYVVVSDPVSSSGLGIVCTHNDDISGLYEPDYDFNDFYIKE